MTKQEHMRKIQRAASSPEARAKAAATLKRRHAEKKALLALADPDKATPFPESSMSIDDIPDREPKRKYNKKPKQDGHWISDADYMILKMAKMMLKEGEVSTSGHLAKVIADLAFRHGDKFVMPKTTEYQRYYFGDRVEVVSPSGHTRRGIISITTGWQPSLLLVHRKGQHGSWDLLNENDIIVAWIDSKSKRHMVPHDELQVAVYQAQREES